MPKLILGLTGQIGSGKGFLCDYLVEAYGAERFKFSTYLSRALQAMGLEPSRDNFIRMSEVLRTGFGENALSHAVARDASMSTAPLAVIDGLRRLEDLTNLKPLPNFRLAAVEAEQRIRYARIANRGEKSDELALSWEDFLANEQRSTEQTVPHTMAHAHIRLQNNGEPHTLKKQVDALMAEQNIPRL